MSLQRAVYPPLSPPPHYFTHIAIIVVLSSLNYLSLGSKMKLIIENVKRHVEVLSAIV